MEHDLENFLAQPEAGETDRQRRNGALDRHDGEKIDHRNSRAKGVGDTKKSRKGREMRDDRSAKSDQRGAPMMGVEMISGRKFNQLFPPGKCVRQLMRTD